MLHYVSLLHKFKYSTTAVHPNYSPKTIQVAIIGQPYEFDFNYTSGTPPTSFKWAKNGVPFHGDGERVTFDHAGIIFTRVLQHDAGQYQVTAKNTAGEAIAKSTLRGKPTCKESGTVSRFSYASHLFVPLLYIAAFVNGLF